MDKQLTAFEYHELHLIVKSEDTGERDQLRKEQELKRNIGIITNEIQ